MIGKSAVKMYKDFGIVDRARTREGIGMNLLNMRLNIGYFNIKINIDKNIEEQEEIDLEKIKRDKKMKEIIEESKSMAHNFHKLNIF